RAAQHGGSCASADGLPKQQVGRLHTPFVEILQIVYDILTRDAGQSAGAEGERRKAGSFVRANQIREPKKRLWQTELLPERRIAVPGDELAVQMPGIKGKLVRQIHPLCIQINGPEIQLVPLLKKGGDQCRQCGALLR